MTKELILEVQSRTEKNNLKKIKQEGFVPGVLYGPNVKNVSLKITKRDLDKIYSKTGGSGLIDLNMDSQKRKVIIKDVQRDPIKGDIIHVDFYQVDMNKKIAADIPLNFSGKPKAAKELGGTLIKNMESVRVFCLPADLVEKINVDLSSLETFADSIKVADLKLPENFELISELKILVASVLRPRIEKEEEKIEEKAGEEGEEEEKKEGEESKKEDTEDKKDENKD